MKKLTLMFLFLILISCDFSDDLYEGYYIEPLLETVESIKVNFDFCLENWTNEKEQICKNGEWLEIEDMD